MSRVFIIAEAGVNHNGDINIAKKLIDEGVKAGVDAIKFQTFNSEKLVTKSAGLAEYQKKSFKKGISQLEMLKKLELEYYVYEELIDYCNKKNVMFLSSPFDIESVYLLDRLGVEIFKIPSGEIENVPYLKAIARTNKRVILSTGMSNLADVEFALDILIKNGTKDIVVLHCNTDYPTKMDDVNLNAMNTIKEAFKVEVGYSDHTNGIVIPIAAVTLGAKVIEKHFTLDRNMEGPDHKASLEPNELKEMVDSIRAVELALGDGIKRPTEIERKNRLVARKSIVCSKEIKVGEIYTEENICIKRPGTGISPKQWGSVIGRLANRNYEKDELIEL